MKTVTNVLKSLFLSLMMTTAFFANAQDEEAAPALTFSGSVDTYYRAAPGYGNTAPGSSFANGTGFSMGMINLKGSYDGENTGVVADLVFGPRGVDAAFGAPYGRQLVNQMYAYWTVNDKLTLTMGQWNTYLGYEVISPTANFNYSTSYMFSWGPFSQAGIKANIAVSETIGLTLAVMNPTDVLETYGGGNYTYGAQLSFATDLGAVYLNTRAGDASGKLFQGDLTAALDLSETFFLGINATYLDDNGAGFYGAAIYPKIAISDAFAIGARAEYFAITGGYIGGAIGLDTDGDGSVVATTLSANYKVGSLTFIPEVRFDFTSEDSYAELDGTASSTLPSVILAAVYSF